MHNTTEKEVAAVEVERFRLRAREKELLQIALNSLDFSVNEAKRMYAIRTGAIMSDHDLPSDTLGVFRRLENDIVFYEFVDKEPVEATDAPLPE